MMLSDADINTIYVQAMAVWVGVTQATRLELVRQVPEHERAAHQKARQRFHEMILFGIVQGEERSLRTYQVGQYQMAYELETNTLFVIEPTC